LFLIISPYTHIPPKIDFKKIHTYGRLDTILRTIISALMPCDLAKELNLKLHIILSSLNGKPLLLTITHDLCSVTNVINEEVLINLLNKALSGTKRVGGIEISTFSSNEDLLSRVISMYSYVVVLDEGCPPLSNDILRKLRDAKALLVIGGYKGYPEGFTELLKRNVGNYACTSISRVPYQVHQVIEIIKFMILTP